ncbi:MAG: ABC transporter ATP-binding protein [Pseudomonadota bacterium]
MAKVSIENIEKSFGQTQVLKGVSLDIEDGEFVSLVGPSGCGKSTLLRIIAGLEAQDAGDILIGPDNVNTKRAADRNLSMVFQSYALYPHLSVAENIAVPLKMRQMSGLQRLPVLGSFMPGSKKQSVEIGEAVTSAAKTLQIDHLLDRKPGQLSGGQRQRVAVGRALVREPAAFLLDEPLSNLDAKLRVHTRAEIAQLHRQLGATFIYVTHDQVEAMTMSDRIAVMMDGEILQIGSPEEIYDHPADVRVAEFMGLPKMAILPAEADKKGEITLLGTATKIYSEMTSCFLKLGIRPEHFVITKSYPILQGRLVHLENLGSENYAHVTLDGLTEPIVIKTQKHALKAADIGEILPLGFDAADIHLFDEDGKALSISPKTSPHKKLVRRMASV